MADFIKIFPAVEDDPFQNYYDACRWLKDNGYSYGPSQMDAPSGILKGDFAISKMRNMTKKQQSELDGLLYSGRHQEAKIVIKRNKPDET